MREPRMTIGQVAGRCGMTTEAIRFYERKGLLPEAARTHTGYRIYDSSVLGRLRFIKRARHLGLSLDEVKEISGMAARGHAPCCHVRELLAEKLSELDRKITELRQLRAELEGFIEHVADLPDQADASESICKLIETAP